ncbi:hypothetical protein [Halobacterium bonnevillei]|uniref:Uncharacterized protein n=1 Tax=Halobacterium bonnevillei TaxID=2692200 RepID=A0A6B0SR03_9EURY|nr:hypothetical protein [Halobacterium bonnevillei]MXR21290.1 hypothetical protein [Halobacterium bonnevillei]
MPDPERSDAAPERSNEHVSRGNKFTLQVALAWATLVVLNAVFGQTGAFSFVFVGVLTLGATWVLVHALFEHVDQLIETRIEEAAAAGEESGTGATPE